MVEDLYFRSQYLAVNDFMLDNMLQSLMQATTPTTTDNPYYYTWLPAWSQIICKPYPKLPL